MVDRILLWLVGADPELLARCSRLRSSERQRLAALGGTVLIPGALAMCSWGYAAWTFIRSAPVAITFGLAGAAIIMWIDRLLLLSTHKSSLQSWWGFWSGLAIRIMLSVTLNYFLADPLMLLVFKGPIEQQMQDDVRAREIATYHQADALRSDAYAHLDKERLDATRDLSAQLANKTLAWECMNSLVTLEMAGGVPAGTPVADRKGMVCGHVSGKAGCKDQCRNDIAVRDQLASDIRGLREDIDARQKEIDKGNVSAALQEGLRIRQQVRAETPPTDYATRRRALGRVEAANSVIRWAHRYLILVLIVIDSIAFVIKAIIPLGEYEEQRDTALAVARATARAERDAALEWIATHGQKIQQEHLSHEASKRQIIAISQGVRALAEELTREFRLFQVQLHALSREIAQLKDEEVRATCIKLLASLQLTFNEGLEEALKRFRGQL